LKIFSKTHRAKKKKVQIYWQDDLMAIKKNNVASVHRRNISQYDSGERCGPWASCLISLTLMHINGCNSDLKFTVDGNSQDFGKFE
jgi:hypothetical protein